MPAPFSIPPTNPAPTYISHRTRHLSSQARPEIPQPPLLHKNSLSLSLPHNTLYIPKPQNSHFCLPTSQPSPCYISTEKSRDRFVTGGPRSGELMRCTLCIGVSASAPAECRQVVDIAASRSRESLARIGNSCARSQIRARC